MSQKVSLKGILDGISAQDTVVKSACGNVAFSPQLAGLGLVELCAGCLCAFSFQWSSRDDDEDAESVRRPRFY